MSYIYNLINDVIDRSDKILSTVLLMSVQAEDWGDRIVLLSYEKNRIDQGNETKIIDVSLSLSLSLFARMS